MNQRILCFGEIVADLIEGKDGVLMCKVGGAPLNVAVGLGRLGERSTLFSAVGGDWFGEKGLSYLKSKRIRSIVSTLPDLPTRMTVISHDRNRERSFKFSPGVAAENAVMPDERTLAGGYEILYFGSFPFSRGSGLPDFKNFVRSAREAGIATVFDPNIRLGIFANQDEARKICLELLSLSDVVRLNVDELKFIYGKNSKGRKQAFVRKATAWLLAEGPHTVFVTDGPVGSYACRDGEFEFMRSFKVKAVDSTGCGDAFTAAIISKLCDEKDTGAHSSLTQLLRWANAAGAAAATKLGGADSMPTKIDIERLIKSNLRGGGMGKKLVSSRGFSGLRTRIN